jgi:hypothetical protein
MDQTAETSVDLAAFDKLHVDCLGIVEDHDKHRNFVDLPLVNDLQIPQSTWICSPGQVTYR